MTDWIARKISMTEACELYGVTGRELLTLSLQGRIDLFYADDPGVRAGWFVRKMARALGPKYLQAACVASWLTWFFVITTVVHLVLLIFRPARDLMAGFWGARVIDLLALIVSFIVVRLMRFPLVPRQPTDFVLDRADLRSVLESKTDCKIEPSTQRKAEIAQEISPKGRLTALRLILGMAVQGYGYDPAAKRSPIPKEIADDLAKMGYAIDDDTVRNWLNEAKSTLD